MIHTWSLHLANYIGNELKLDNRKIVIVSYGTEVLIGALIKLVAFILIPFILGVFKLFATAYISFALLRLPSGGVHCSAFYRCLITSTITYLGIALIAKYLATLNMPSIEVLWVVLLMALIVFIKLAPVDVKEKPIRSTLRRKRLKFISCLMVIVIFVVFLFWQPGHDITWATSLAILFQVFTLTKAGHSFFGWVDKII